MSIFKKILAVVAPTLASALPGPLGSIAKKAITDALGLDADTADEKIDQVLATANPEILAKIKAAEAQFQVDMKKLDIDFGRLTVDDRGSARARQMAVRDTTPMILSYAVVAAWTGCVMLLFIWTPPEANRQLLEIMFAVLTVTMKDVYGFWFGSSFGSEKKTEIMAGETK